MISELRKFIKRGRKAADACADILGNSEAVNKFAQFWEYNGDDLMLISAVRLHEYTGGEHVFTKEELGAYKKGVADIAMFFKQCSDEIEKKKRDAIAGINKSV